MLVDCNACNVLCCCKKRDIPIIIISTRHALPHSPTSFHGFSFVFLLVAFLGDQLHTDWLPCAFQSNIEDENNTNPVLCWYHGPALHIPPEEKKNIYRERMDKGIMSDDILVCYCKSLNHKLQVQQLIIAPWLWQDTDFAQEFYENKI